jgi:hypothetical protein
MQITRSGLADKRCFVANKNQATEQPVTTKHILMTWFIEPVLQFVNLCAKTTYDEQTNNAVTHACKKQFAQVIRTIALHNESNN